MNEIRTIFAFFNQKDKAWAIFLIFQMVIVSTLEVLSLAILLPFLNGLIKPDEITNSEIFTYFSYFFRDLSGKRFLLLLGCIAIILTIVTFVFRILNLLMINRFCYGQQTKISSNLLSSYLNYPYEKVNNNHTGDLIRKCGAETDKICVDVFVPFFKLISSSVNVLVTVILLAVMFPVISGAILSILATIYLVIFVFIKAKMQLFGQQAFRYNSLRFNTLNDALLGLKTVKIYNLYNYMLMQYYMNAKNVHKNLSVAATLSDLPRFFIESIGFVALIGFCIFTLAHGQSDRNFSEIFPTLGIIGLAGLRILPGLQSIYIGLSKLKFGSDPMVEILSDLKSDKFLTTQFSDTNEFEDKISLENVVYLHDDKSVEILSDVNLTVFKGEKIAIIGESGSGKSTLLDIICGLRRPISGTVMLDSKVLPENNSIFAYVAQDTFIFSESLRLNLMLTDTGGEETDRKILSLLQDVGLNSIIEANASDPLDNEFGFQGNSLSGGQRQRLGILRGLLSGRPVLVLDEVTSALDDKNTEIVIKLISDRADLTVIMVTHKMHSLDVFDAIYELKDGSLSRLNTKKS